MDEFISRANINRFQMQLLESSDEVQKATLRTLMNEEKQRHRDILADRLESLRSG